LFRQVLPLGVEGEAVVLGERSERLQIIGRRRFCPRRNRTAAQRALLVVHDEIGMDVLLDPEAAASRAGAERIVERKQPRLDLGNREAGDRAGEFLREDDALRPAVVMDLGELLFFFTLPCRGRVGAQRRGGAVPAAAPPPLPARPAPPPRGGGGGVAR